MAIEFRAPITKNEFEKYFLFRWEMLRKPLNLPLGSEQDNLEENAFHIAAYDEDAIIGLGRIHLEVNDSARIRYMAVHENHRRHGIGSSILSKLEQIAKNNNVHLTWLYARDNVVNFYRKNGYEISGKNNSELLNVKHERMQKLL